MGLTIRGRWLPWVFDRGAGTMERGRRSWRMEDVAGMRVTPLRWNCGFRLCADFKDAAAPPLTVAWYLRKQSVSDTEIRKMLGEVGGRIGAFTGVPCAAPGSGH